MTQTGIPCLFMRGGTSRGPYMNRAALPEDRDTLAEVLMAAVGAGHSINIDGIGGGVAVTTKVAMLSSSDHEWADVDYFFAQVSVDQRIVDFGPSCGNILSGVGPAAIEMGLVDASDPETRVRIRALNTGGLTEAVVQTPGGVVEYAGDAHIDGVPGTAAPVILNFMDVVGSKTGKLFPTNRPVDSIDGIELTCMDAAVPTVIARADAFGLSGYESTSEIDANRGFYERMEPIRRKAGERMGLGDVSEKVVPKFAVLAPAREGGTATARYFMPFSCHPSMAVTGSICIGACLMAPDTVAEGLANRPTQNPAPVRIEHPSGAIEVSMDCAVENGAFDLKAAGLLRTARKLMSGELFVPAAVWDGESRDSTVTMGAAR